MIGFWLREILIQVLYHASPHHHNPPSAPTQPMHDLLRTLFPSTMTLTTC